MWTITYSDVHARHDLIVESACLWLNDANALIMYMVNPDVVTSVSHSSSTGKGYVSAWDQKLGALASCLSSESHINIQAR